MSTLTITKSYQDTSILYESDLDYFKTDIETFFNITGITDDNIQANSLTASSILDNSAITTAKIQDSAITESKLETGSSSTGITTSKIQDNAVTTVKIADSAVTNIKLAGSITQDKIAINTFDDTKVSPSYNINSSYDVSYNPTTTSPENTGLSVTLSLSGLSRPVLIQLNGGTGDPGLGNYAGCFTTGNAGLYIYLYRGATLIAKYLYEEQGSLFGGSSIPASVITFLDIGATGSSATYSIYLSDSSGVSSGRMNTVSMTCLEI